MDTNSESETNDLLISDLIINFNKLVLEGQSFYRSRERTLALEKYNQALLLAEKMRDPEKIAYLKTNIAIVDFENGEYKACLLQLEDAFSLLSSLNKGELLNELRIKLLSSLCVINIVLNHLEKAKEYGSKITNLLMNLTPIARKPAMELVVFSLYKFMNFPSMNEISLEGVEEIYQGVPLACFYSSIGLNRELNDDHSQALNYYLKALDVWKNCNEIGFVLITLKHLINIAPKAGLNGSDTGNFMKLYQKLLQADDFKGVNIEQLFKDYEQRLETAKEITFNLKSFEEKLISEERSPNSHDNGEFWKQALRLRLLKSLKMAKNLISNSNTNTNPGVQIQLLSNGTDQILSTLALIQEETNPIILNKVQTMAYTKDASNSLKAAVNRIKKIILYHIYARALEKITNFSDKKAMKILKKSQITALYTKAYGEIMQGDYLIKCNNNSNGRIRKFFRLDLSGILLVATKEIFIENISKRREIDLSAVDALLYGKVTPTLIKIYNKSLENHLCFSLIYKGKTIDFYCTEDQVKSWIIALSREIKKKNPMAFCLEAGRLLWRGFRLRIIEEFKRTIEKQGGKIKIIVRESLVKAVNYFARNNKNLRLK